MEHNGQGAEGQVPTSQSSGSAGTAPMDIQEEVPRRVSFATYRRHSSIVGPQEENIPGDPVAFRNEDYLSRPSWLFDIGRYPVTLSPHVGNDGVPQKTPSGTPIYATEERDVRRPLWHIDTSQHAHIVHYGTRRRSSTGAPYFVTADQAGHRPSEFSDSEKFSSVPSVSTVEGRGRRKSSLAFATEDGHLHSPSWLDNTEKYTAITGPQMPGGGAPRRPSIRAPVSGAQEEHPRRPSMASEDRISGIHGVEGAPRRRSLVAPGLVTLEDDGVPGAHGVEGAPGRRSLVAPGLVTLEDDGVPGAHGVEGAPGRRSLVAPGLVTLEDDGVPGAHGVEGAPGRRSLVAPGLVTLEDDGVPGAHGVEGAPGRRSLTAPGSLSPEELSCRPSKGVDAYPVCTAPHIWGKISDKTPTGVPAMSRVSWVGGKYSDHLNFSRMDRAPRKPAMAAVSASQKGRPHTLSWLIENYPFPSSLYIVDGAPQKPSTGPLVAVRQEDHLPRSYWISDRKWKDLVYPSSGVENRGSAEEELSDSSESSDEDSVTTLDSQPPSASSRPLIEGQATGNLAASKYSAARETKRSKGQVFSEVTKSIQSDLSPHRDPRSPTDMYKTPAEENPQLLAHSHTKKRHQKKQHKMSPHPITATTQTQKGQVLNALLTESPASSPRAEGKAAGNTSTSAAVHVQLGRSSLKTTQKVSFDKRPSRTEDRAMEHLANRDVANKLKPGKAASPTKIGHKTSSLQTTKGGTSRTESTQATLGAENLKQDGASKNMQETQSQPPAVAPAADSQAAGTHSTAQVSTVDKATESTIITDGKASPTKLAVKPTRLLPLRAKDLALLKEKYSSRSPQGQGLLATRDNLKTEKFILAHGDVNYVLQTLHIGRVKLLPTMFKPLDLNRAAEYDLNVKGINICSPLEKSQEPSRPLVKSQDAAKSIEKTKCQSSLSACPAPPSSPYSLVSSERLNLCEWVYSKDYLIEIPTSQIESRNQKDSNQSYQLPKLPFLKENLQRKRLDALRRISVIEKEILLQNQLQQKKQL